MQDLCSNFKETFYEDNEGQENDKYYQLDLDRD